MRLAWTALIPLLLSSLGAAGAFHAASGQEPTSTLDIIRNGSFEQGVDGQGLPVYWGNWTKHSSGTGTVTVDSARSMDGNSSVKLTLGQVQIGFAAVYQIFHINPTTFRDLTDLVGNIDLWFYLEPKYSGLGDFVVKVYSQKAEEIDYVFDPDPRLSYPNQTFLDGRPFVKSFLFGDLSGTSPNYPAGEWHRFNFRNLRADWQAPMAYHNSTCSPCLLPGFGLDETFARLELLIVGFQDISTSSYYSGTAWVDVVQVFVDTTPPAPDTSPPTWPYPAILSYSNLSPTGVSLSWPAAEDNVGVVAYRLFANDLLLAQVPADTHNYTLSGLTPEAVYGFRVEAGDAAENWSTDGPQEILVTPPLTARLTEVYVWSDTCGSSTISLSNPSCGPLEIDNLISVEVKVSNAAPFNAYDFYLYFDPATLQAVSVDVSTDTVFPQSLVASQQLTVLGVVRLAVLGLGPDGVFLGIEGTLAHISFKILGLGVSPLTLAAGMAGPSTHAQSYTILALQANYVDATCSDAHFSNTELGQGPVASFEYTPLHIQTDQVVTFDATASYDPDRQGVGNGIFEYIWDFGDGGGATVFTPTTTHVFRGTGTGPSFVGNFSVRLTVVDSESLQGMKTMRVEVEPKPLRDLELFSLMVTPYQVTQGENVTVQLSVRNRGTESAIYDLTVQVGPPGVVFGTVTSQEILPLTNQQFSFVLATEGLESSVYTINATVTTERDDDLSNNYRTQAIVVLRPRLAHDVAVSFVAVYPGVVVSGQFAGIQLGIRNLGLNDEVIDLTFWYDSTVIDTLTGVLVTRDVFEKYIDFIWDTSGVAPGTYSITVSANLPSDEDLSNNEYTSSGTVRILPPPEISLTPSSGGLGTKVNVHGSGFQLIGPSYPGFSLILVSFDDMFLGFTVAQDSSFDFTFNVPHAETGPHTVKVLEVSSGIRATASFEVLDASPPGPSHFSLTINTGAIYFQGETVDVFVQAALDGTPESTGVDVQVLLVKPDGSSVSLTAQVIGPGLYKASFTVPRTQGLGTYAVMAEAHYAGGLSASALGSFQVKPTWLNTSPGRATTIAAAVAGIIAIVGFTQRDSLFRRIRRRNREQASA